MTPQIRLRFHRQPQGAIWYFLERSQHHVLIDPQPEARVPVPGFVRPIELWRASRWQHPPSVAVVRHPGIDGSDTGSVAESDQPPGPGEIVNLRAVVDFVSDPLAARLGVLALLIDAVDAALAGGLPVVLAVADPDEAALWIGAVSFFVSPSSSLRLSFSTHERWDDVVSQLDSDASGARARADRPTEAWGCPRLSVVSPSDVESLNGRDDPPVVVIDPRVEPTLVTVDQREYRRTHLGRLVEIGEASREALTACREDYEVLEQRILRRDEVDRMGDVSRDGSPSSPTATVWDRLHSMLVDGPARADRVRPTFENYLRLALEDDEWLLRRAPPLPLGVPPELLVEAGLSARLRGPLAGLGHRLVAGLLPDPSTDPSTDPSAGSSTAWTADSSVASGFEPSGFEPSGEELVEDVRRGLLLLRGLDFAHRISRLIGGPDLTSVGLGHVAERAAEVLLEPTVGPKVAAIVGPVDAEALAGWLVPLMARPTEPGLDQEMPVGRRLPAAVVALFAGVVDPVRLDSSGRSAPGAASEHADPITLEPVALEVAVASASGWIAGDPRLRGPAGEYLLHQAARRYPDADPGPMVAEVFTQLTGGPGWPAEALLRLVERAPAKLEAELVPIVLRLLPDWVDDPLSARLSAALLKRIQFLPPAGVDGQQRPRRGGVTDDQAQLLNLLASSGAGWLRVDDGLHRRAAEILMWGDRAWPEFDQQVRRLIAARLTVAAFQVALAAGPDLAHTPLHSRLETVPTGSSWRSAVTLGLEPALPMLAEMLRLNRFRLAGELVVATTRMLLTPEVDAAPETDRPRLVALPVGPVIHWLVSHTDEPALRGHLAALIDDEVHAHPGPVDRPAMIEFWERALPDGPVRAREPEGRSLPEPILDDVLQVALGLRPGDFRSTEGRWRPRPSWWRW